MNARERLLGMEQMRRDCISVPRAYIDAAGDLAAGVMLAQILYWFGEKKEGGPRVTIEKDGRVWLAKRWTDWQKECRLSEDQARRCARILVDRGLIEQDVFRWEGSPTVHFTVDFDAMETVLAQMEMVKNPDPGGESTRSNQGNSPDPLYRTETTPEITSRKKKRASTRKAAEPVPIPDPPAEIDSPELRAFLPEWVEHRKAKGKPMVTDHMWKDLFNNLRAAGKDNAVVALKYARQKNWISFELQYLQGKSWPEVRSLVGEPERRVLNPQPSSTPVDHALEDAKDRARQIERDQILVAADGWSASTRSIALDLVAEAKSQDEINLAVGAAVQLDANLRSLGAYPLQPPAKGAVEFEPDVLTSKSGARWRVEWSEWRFVVAPRHPVRAESSGDAPCEFRGGPSPCYCEKPPDVEKGWRR